MVYQKNRDISPKSMHTIVCYSVQIWSEEEKEEEEEGEEEDEEEEFIR